MSKATKKPTTEVEEPKTIEEPTTEVEAEQVEETFSGLAVSRTNVKMAKLSRKMKFIKSIMAAEPETSVDALTKLLYPDWENMTQEKFENVEWYVKDMLLPLLETSPEEVYKEALDEEQSKLLTQDEAKEKYTW